MLSEQTKQYFEKTRWVHRLLIATLFFEGIVLYFIKGAGNSTNLDFLPTHRLVLSFMALGEVVGSVFIHKIILQSVERSSADARDELACARMLFTADITAMALCEAAAVYGFILSFLRGSMIDFYVLSAMALLGLWYWRPEEHVWSERMRRLV